VLKIDMPADEKRHICVVPYAVVGERVAVLHLDAAAADEPLPRWTDPDAAPLLR
jgi:hypothetical protein